MSVGNREGIVYVEAENEMVLSPAVMGFWERGEDLRPDGQDERSTAQRYGDDLDAAIGWARQRSPRIALRMESGTYSVRTRRIGGLAVSLRAPVCRSYRHYSAGTSGSQTARTRPSNGPTARAMRRQSARPDSAVSSGWWPRSTPGRVSRPTATACGGRSSARSRCVPGGWSCRNPLQRWARTTPFRGAGNERRSCWVCGWLDLRVLLGGRGATCRYRYPLVGLALGQPHPTGQRTRWLGEREAARTQLPDRERSRARPGWPRRLELVAEAWGSQAPPRSNSLPRRPSRQGEAGALLRTVLIEEVDRHGGTRLLGCNDHTEICR